MLNGPFKLFQHLRNIRSTFVERMLVKCWNRLNGLLQRQCSRSIHLWPQKFEPRVMLMSIIQQYMSKNVCSIVSLVFSRLSRLGFLDSLDSSLFFRKFIFYMVPRPENIDSLKNSLSLEIWLMKNWKEEKDPRRTKRIRYDDSGKGKSLTRWMWTSSGESIENLSGCSYGKTQCPWL